MGAAATAVMSANVIAASLVHMVSQSFVGENDGTEMEQRPGRTRPPLRQHWAERNVSSPNPRLHPEVDRFMVQLNNPNANPDQVERLALHYIFHTQKLPVFHKFKLWLGNPNEHHLMSDEFDIIHACPSQKGPHKEKIAAQFDTVLVHLFTGVGPYHGVRGI